MMHKARKVETTGGKRARASQGLTPSAASVNEMKDLLGDVVRKLRRKSRLSQTTLARMMGSSQPRIAKLENRDPQVSMDLQLRAIFAANPDARHDVAALIHKWSGATAAPARQPRKSKRTRAAARRPARPARR
jgi:transcriptional regulator with XRE-family HTH domain